MVCKNCEKTLRTDYSFCPDCGAKIIRNRITIKNLWYDAVERFLNIDNTFLKTFVSLFTKPEEVIGGYIHGLRKKYLNPISYFTIAIALGGLFIFLYTNFFPDAMNYQFESMDMDNLSEADKVTVEFSKKYVGFVFEYQSLFYVLMIPFLALISKLIFIDKKEYNLSEHFVMNIYGYSQMSICINSIYILLIWSNKLVYYASAFNLIFQILYFAYIFKKIFSLSIKQIIIRTLLFLAFLSIIVIGIGILAGIYLAVFTDTFQHLAPK